MIKECVSAMSLCKRARAARGYRERSVGAAEEGTAALEVEATTGGSEAWYGLRGRTAGVGSVEVIVVVVDIVRRVDDETEVQRDGGGL